MVLIEFVMGEFEQRQELLQGKMTLPLQFSCEGDGCY